jgi:hypothetical protein
MIIITKQMIVISYQMTVIANQMIVIVYQMIVIANQMIVRSVMMADTSWTNNPKLKNIDPRKLTVLLELMKEAEGKPMDKLLPILMNTNKKLQDQNLSFSKDESDVMIDLLTKNLNQKEKMQFEMIKKMMANRK